MTYPLWRHQDGAINKTLEAMNAHRPAGLWVMPTGTGKTRTFLTLAHDLGLPTLVLVHRDELIRQTLKTAAGTWPEATTGVIQGKHNDWQGRDLVVASVPSLHAGRLGQMPPGHFRLVIADECHHLPASSWGRVVDSLRPWFFLGVTATPDRLDGQGLARWFGDTPLYTYQLRQAIDDGGPVPVRSWAVHPRVDLDAVGVQAGDFIPGELRRAVAVPARNRAIVEAYQARAAGRQAIAFAVDRAHVHQLALAFESAGSPTASV